MDIETSKMEDYRNYRDAARGAKSAALLYLVEGRVGQAVEAMRDYHKASIKLAQLQLEIFEENL